MTNQQVVGLLLKSSLSGEPLCLRVSLHMADCACVPCKPLRSTLSFPVTSVHASVNLPGVLYRALQDGLQAIGISKEILESVPDGKHMTALDSFQGPDKKHSRDSRFFTGT